MKNKSRGLFYGFLSSIIYFLFFGMISVIFSNPFFIRMTPVKFFDWILIIISSILVGIFVYQYFLLKKVKDKSIICATYGGIFSFMAFSCPICNKLIILLFGFSGAMTYFASIQPLIGIVGILLLVYANYNLFKQIKK